jgi:putative phosphoribosyl transferase
MRHSHDILQPLPDAAVESPVSSGDSPAAARNPAASFAPLAPHAVEIQAGDASLDGDLAIPHAAHGLVLFAHGSGSSRYSPRNRYVADALRLRGHATLLMDLLTPAEERADVYTGEYRFDIPLLASRLTATIDWLCRHQTTSALRIGLFGASTGAAAALIAAAERPAAVAAIVSRGGRPDLAGDALGRVKAPTLLIVGGSDEPVIDLNREALARMPGVTRLEIVSGATHLFEEPGALEEVARLAGMWFDGYLAEGD